MSYLDNVNIGFADTPAIDAFGRLRISEPFTIFDSKQLHDSQPLFWDDSETSGSGTSTSHSANEAATTISVGATTAGTRVRQTYQRFNYQPGKSQQILCTFSEFDTDTGITKRVGYFDGENGLFFESDEGTLNVARRTYVTGSAVDTKIAQSSWNIDTLDGNGDSGITLDLTKTQIGIIDFEWLGVGRVRFGFVIDGLIYYCHELKNANSLTQVYMSTPNLPVRYEISNDGTGAADDFIHICTSVKSEGGQEDNGIILGQETSSTITGLTSGNTYAMIGLRHQSTKLDAIAKVASLSTIATTNNDQAMWKIYLNPTVAGTFTYSDVSNSAMQTAVGSNSNTISGGTFLAGGYFITGAPLVINPDTARYIGSAIDGTRDEMVLCVEPVTANISARATLSWRELS